MRPRIGWCFLSMLSSLALAGCQGDDVKKVSLGDAPAYKTFGQLPVLHQGRVKPVDTVAREEIKTIYTRETIKLTSEDGKTVTSWSPVAAFLDWSVRPKFWDDQPIIAVEYLPLKQFIFHDEVHEALDGIASKPSTAEADKPRLQTLAHSAEIDARAIQDVVRDSKLPIEDGKALLKLAAKVGEGTKWFSPNELQNAQVTMDGKPAPFFVWLDGISRRKEASRGMAAEDAGLSVVENRGFDVGIKLAHYRSIRDKTAQGMVPIQAMPIPINPTLLAFTADAVIKMKDQNRDSLSPLEEEVTKTFFSYIKLLPDKDKALPGQDAKFDERYTAWLKDKAAWISLETLRNTPVEMLAAAGLPAPKVEAFRKAYQAVEDAEMVNPGRASDAPSDTLIASAHDLGMAINAGLYPLPSWMKTETHFNDLAPFFKAPMAYFAGFLLILFSLASRGSAATAATGSVSRVFYYLGMVAFASGIALEAYGFYLRVSISGWAPVSNMYETMIWVAMVLSVLAFVIEAIHRRAYAALAGSFAALIGTYLAATIPMVDPKIPQLPPVLRSNYWLTIHVLTIVSSYAAFALAWGLGLIASWIYLTTTYKRSASFLELAKPLVPGLPLLGVGIAGLVAANGDLTLGTFVDSKGFWPSLVLATVGGVITGSGVFAILGEAVNRLLHPSSPSLDSAALAGEARNPGRSKSRAESMQATAAQIKPIAGFIYRSMQVGILLVAAGTFLGGWWADVSWGRFWGWDPKEVWALITLLVYLIPLHGRFAGWVNTFWLVMASVACFLSVLMAWYGVNFVLGVGLHSYGFSEGGSQGTVLAATVVVLGYAAGAFWRRKVSSLVVA